MPSSAPPRVDRPGRPTTLVRAQAEPVEVRRGPAGGGPDGLGPPTQLLWRDALWVVREAHRIAEPVSAGCWRVLAGQGPDQPQQGFQVWPDVDGHWWLQLERS